MRVTCAPLGGGAPCLLKSLDHVRRCQTHATLLILLSVRHASKQGAFPPRRLCCPPNAIGTMSPSDFLPGSPLKADREARPLTRLALPCCPVCGVDVPRPLPRRASPWSPVGCSHGLQRPSRLCRPVGPRDGTFETCASVTPIAAHRLAAPPTVGLCPEGFSRSVTLATASVATGVSRQLPRQDLHL